ncbi:thioredoxin fold domain-containing protein [Flavobacterium sp. MK4S-17]|jgi:thioredoxin-related protein|uniref:thioredoxin family protein n=1 Tax=Flavobacterium sp. MK4S-17 TaxID=2543737 RepID=UPI00135B8BBE|nr:thioredoxin fold domain-containing protein [Flavobacterium sp. MK4S-17]
MKKLLLILFIALGTVAAQAQEIKWMTLEEALAAQKKAPKPIFMDIYTDWCGPCKMLDKNTFHDKAVVDYISQNFYAVKFNAEGNSEVSYKGKTYKNPNFQPERRGRNAIHEFTLLLKVRAYPTMMLFDSKGEINEPVVGYYTPEQLLPLLKSKQL